MSRRSVAFVVVSTVVGLLSGCGLFVYEQRAPWRDEAEQACLASKAVKVSAYVEPAREIAGPGACGMIQPFRISALADGTVGLSSRATLACPIIPVLDGWLEDTVQPAAQLYWGSPVVELRAGSYSCRNINNRAGGSRSEHAFGNAMDVMAFRLADGREITVEKGWRGSTREQEFLREVFVGSCARFSTVLGPGSDAEHYNHFHLDLARHSRGRTICKPVLKFEPRLPAYIASGGQLSPRGQASLPPASPGTGGLYVQAPGSVSQPPLPSGRTTATAGASRPLMLPAPGGREDDDIADLIEEQGISDPGDGVPLRPPAPVRRY